MLQQLTDPQKKKIVAAIKTAAGQFPGTAGKHATSLGINPSVYSVLMKGEIDKKLREADWYRIGRQLQVNFGGRIEWKIVETSAFKYITSQLRYCQENGISRVFCDTAGLGKTTALKEYARNNANAIYLDCSQMKKRKQLIRGLSKACGLDHVGKLDDVLADLLYFLASTPGLLIMLDEVGDLEYPAFLELKAMWNSGEYQTAWYLTGAEGLKAKWERMRANKKVGYAEMFRRFGSDYKKISPDNLAEHAQFTRKECHKIASKNLPGVPLEELIKKGPVNQTAVYEAIIKYKRIHKEP